MQLPLEASLVPPFLAEVTVPLKLHPLKYKVGLTLTGTGNLTFGPSSAFGGDATTVSPTSYFGRSDRPAEVASVKIQSRAYRRYIPSECGGRAEGQISRTGEGKALRGGARLRKLPEQ